jgi:hypothetical protein
MKRRRWVEAAIVLSVIAVVVFFANPRYLGPTRTSDRIFEVKRIIYACEAYRFSPSNTGNKPPAKLADLIHPPFEGGPFVRDAEADLLDPWGNPYRYALVPSAEGKFDAYVWSERVVDGRLTLIGAKLQADGGTHFFGLPK